MNKNIIWFIVCKVKGIESMWNDHWSIMKPAYFIIWFSFNNNFRFSIKWYSRAQQVINMWSTPAVWKQYNKMAVLHFFLVNSSLYILFSMLNTDKTLLSYYVASNKAWDLYVENNCLYNVCAKRTCSISLKIIKL